MLPLFEAELTYLTKEEVERLFRAIPEDKLRDRFLFDVVYWYGLRRSEAAMLRFEDVRERIFIRRVKNGVSKEYPLDERTKRFFREYVETERGEKPGYLFPGRSGSVKSRISPTTIFLRFRKYARLAGIPDDRQNVHVARHSIAVHLMNAGWDLADVQDWLGHRSITSTIIYAKVTAKRRDENFEKALRSQEIAGK